LESDCRDVRAEIEWQHPRYRIQKTDAGDLDLDTRPGARVRAGDALDLDGIIELQAGIAQRGCRDDALRFACAVLDDDERRPGESTQPRHPAAAADGGGGLG